MPRACRSEAEASSSFLKKRTQKLLQIGTEIEQVPGPNTQKFFASFFQKRSPSFRLALLGLTLIRLIVAARAPLSSDEAYYWVWSKSLQGGYLDHPPMVALWIRVGTAICGDIPIGVRLLGPLAAIAGSLLLARAARDLWPGNPRAGVVAALLLNATLILNAGAVVMTPDTPLLFFWTFAIAAIARLIRTGNGAWWLAAGLAGGLAFDSKYTAILLAAALAAWVILVPQARRWLARWEFWAAAALALLITAPVLLWNADHGWVSFLKQGGRAGAWQPTKAIRFLGELIGGQIGLATPGIFLIGCAGIWVACRRALHRSPEWTLLAAITILPAAVFAEHALGGRVQANWPAVIAPGAVLAAAGAGIRFWRPACALGWAIAAVVFVQAGFAPFVLPRALDFTLIRLAGWPEVAGAVFVAASTQHADFVIADEYGLASQLAFRLRQPVVAAEPRWALFSFPEAILAGKTGLLVRSLREVGPPDPHLWPGAALAGTIIRGRAGVEAERYNLYRVATVHVPVAVLLPHAPPAAPAKAL